MPGGACCLCHWTCTMDGNLSMTFYLVGVNKLLTEGRLLSCHAGKFITKQNKAKINQYNKAENPLTIMLSTSLFSTVPDTNRTMVEL